MVFLEMSIDENHGGGNWGFTKCVWAPTRKENGVEWPFWNKILKVREGDTVLHLRGENQAAGFVGYSVASTDGRETTRRPPDPGKWSYAERFFRADLEGFTPFHEPIKAASLFQHRRYELDRYFEMNKARGSRKANVFFVQQSGRLQCQNGAYFSDVDDELLTALFGESTTELRLSSPIAIISVETGTQLALVRSRLGQARFSSEIKVLYGNQCCFPGCPVTDTRFLVGSHIARWSDNPSLRGQLGNGLCFCLMHDKAFEMGLFTLDQQFAIFVNPRERTANSSIVSDLLAHHGDQIRLSRVIPMDDALLEHWIRIDVEP